MKRRSFMLASAVLAAAGPGLAMASESAHFAALRRTLLLPQGRIAYVERGTGEGALFLHGAPLNSYQWRGALERLAPHRRCIAPDFMGLGYSEPDAAQSLAAGAQADMLAALLDKLGVGKVDLVASDSGGAVAQLFAVRFPERVSTILLTNCDVEPNSPPPGIAPILKLAREGKLATMTEAWLTDRALCRSTFGAAVFRDPASLADDTIDYYVKPLVSSPLRRTQYEAFHLALEPNPLQGLEPGLRLCKAPVKLVWGVSDTLFPLADAEYLNRTFPHSKGIRTIPEGKLFFQEEFPDVIAEEARRLWLA